MGNVLHFAAGVPEEKMMVKQVKLEEEIRAKTTPL
jgi:hypothetical protein